MKIAELPPNHTFPRPAAPAPIGPDAALFRAYARYRAAEEAEIALVDREEASASPGGAVEREAAVKAGRAAREAFMRHPACTVEGVIFRLELALAGQSVPADGEIYDEIALAWGALADLKRMVAPRVG